MLRTLLWVTTLVTISGAIPGAGAPAGVANLSTEPLVGPMRAQTMGGFTYFHVSQQVPRAKAAETLPALGTKRDQAATRAQVQTYGPAVVIYRPGDTKEDVVIEVGGMVAEGTQAAGEAQVRNVEPFRCAAVAYCGPYGSLANGYQALVQEVKKAGLKETGEYREFYLYWEANNSPNNVLLLQAGVTDAGSAPIRQSAVGPPRVRTLPGFDYFYADAQTTWAKVGTTVGELWKRVWASAGEAKAHLTGPEVMVYPDATAPDKPFVLQVGKMAAPGSKAAGRAKVRKLAPFRCAAAIYSGSLSGLRAAVGQAAKAVEAKGLKRVKEYREYYLYWEGKNSPNNVLLLQFGIQ